MSALLERYRQQATLLDREILCRDRPSKWDDVSELAQLLYGDRTAKQQMHDVWLNGDPINIAGGLGGLEANPPNADLATVTVNATEAALWPTAYTPIPALLQGPKAYSLKAWGVCTSAATPGTQTFNPRIGTSNAGISLGISSALTPTASETAVVWKIMGDVVLRGGSTTTTTVTGVFDYDQTTGTTGNATTITALRFGGTSASVDNTVAQALWMGLLAVTSTTNTMTPRGVIWASWN
jgi:hypothetical protein